MMLSILGSASSLIDRVKLRDEPNCGLNDLLQRELADSRGRVVLVSQVFGYGDRHGARLRGYTTIDDAFNPWFGK